jgi:hypothetical protein
MTRKTFLNLLDSTFDRIKSVEAKKCSEYVSADEPDRLAHFKEIAAILGQPPHQALRGMMVKHTKSIYDMLKADTMDTYHTDTWREKIDDHIMYLLLLLALEQDNPFVPSEEAPNDIFKDVQQHADNDCSGDFEPWFPR